MTGGFTLGFNGGGPPEMQLSRVSDDLSVVRGNHQLAFFGASAVRMVDQLLHHRLQQKDDAFNGQTTRFGHGGLFHGERPQMGLGNPSPQHKRSKNVGLYGADTWKVNQKLTLNYGLRWEPFFPMIHLDGSAIISTRRVEKGIKSHVYERPSGRVLYRRPRIPGSGRQYTQWWNFSPRLGWHGT